MFRLRRLYLDSCGVAENRFTDLLVEFTDPAGEPTDAIVWLRNGAGKTTMLSLLLALVLPDRRDFLATKTKKRALEDLILAGDTAHIVAEWSGPDGQLLLTGAVHEWKNRVRPLDYNDKGKDRLQSSWWCLAADDVADGANLDELPFTSRSQGEYDRERFCAHIAGFAAQGVNAVVAHSHKEWHAALRERRFDPELFRYFTEVNAAEGGIDGLFSGIDSPGKFVRWLLKFVGDQQRVRPVRDLLEETAAEIAKRPVYLAEKRFCEQAIPKIAALGAAHQAVVAAAAAESDERTRAARHKRALLDAVNESGEQRAHAEQRVSELDEMVKAVRSNINSLRAKRAGYLKIAAELRCASARLGADSAEQEVMLAELDVKAWRAVEDHVALGIREARRDSQRTALLEASQSARPLIENHESAQAQLAGALEGEIAKADEALLRIEAELQATVQNQADAEEQWKRANSRLAELESETTGLRSLIARFNASRQKLVDSGTLGEAETLAAAETRLSNHVAAIKSDIRRLDQERTRIDDHVAAAEKRLEVERAAATAAELAHGALSAELNRLARRATELADHPRLRLLLQTETVDLENTAQDALEALSRALHTADRELIALAETLARDERALHALRTTDLLPPRLQVEKILDELAAAGISAVSGWSYLAQHVETSEHARRIAEHPAAVDGIIVYTETPSAAAAHVHGPVDEVVVISSATVFSEHPSAQFVLGPSPARHDMSAAEAELQAFSTRHDASTERGNELRAQREADDGLRSMIKAFRDELPADGAGGLRSREGAAWAALAEARQHEQDTRSEIDRLRVYSKELTTQISDKREQLARREAELPQIRSRVAEERDEIEPAGIRLDAIPRDQEESRAQEARADERKKAAQSRADDLRLDQRALRDKQAQWKGRRTALRVLASPTILSLEAAEANEVAALEQLHAAFPEEALQIAVQIAEQEVQRAATTWQRHPEQTRARALELAETTAAADESLRAAATVRADDRQALAYREKGRAESELNAAQQEFEQAAAQSALTHGPSVELEHVDDREQALQFASQIQAETEHLEVRRNRHEEDQRSAAAAATVATARASMLCDQTEKLPDVEPAAETSVMLPDDEAQIRSIVTELANVLHATQKKHAAAERAFIEQSGDLSRWASGDDFAKVAEDEHGQAVHRLRTMFRAEEHAQRLAGDADGLAQELHVRTKAIDQQLHQVEEHKKSVGDRLTDLVDEALTVLARASELSKLPAGIGPWEHQKFLVVEAKSRPSREHIGLRVSGLIDAIVNSGRIETDPVELLWRATEASVPDGFRANILKPAPDQPTGRTPVEEMRKWSGGENLTASLVLFCVLARLRAEKRIGSKSASTGGLVPLDNPLGKANYLPFLELQRRVARANGVQLVFWTGIGDLGAVTVFPRIAALHKRPSTNRAGRAYVQVDEENSQVLDIVSAVRDEP